MSDVIAGYLEVGVNERREIVINHPDLRPDEYGCGHIVFSISQARGFVELLLRKISEAESLEGGIR